MESTFAITATAPAKDYRFQNIRPGYILGGNIRFPNFSLRAFWGSEDFSLPMGAPNMRNWGYFVNIGASQMALLGMWGVFVTNSGSRLALLRRWEFVVINEGVPTFLLEEVRIFVTNGGSRHSQLTILILTKVLSNCCMPWKLRTNVTILVCAKKILLG